MERATPESVGIASERLARIEPAMQRFIDGGRTVVHPEARGLADLGAGDPMTRDTFLRIDSMTKRI